MTRTAPNFRLLLIVCLAAARAAAVEGPTPVVAARVPEVEGPGSTVGARAVEVGGGPALAERAAGAEEIGGGAALAERAAGAEEIGGGAALAEPAARAVEVGGGPALAERAAGAEEVGPGTAVAEPAARAVEVGGGPALAERAAGAEEVGPGTAVAERAAGAAAAAGTAPAAGAAVPAAARDAGFQDIAQLEAAAKSAAAPSLPAPTARQRLQVGPIQPGLRLARCESGVKPVIAPGLRERTRVLIELRCDGPSSWHIYVPVRVVGTSAAVMAAHAIVAGSVLTDKDVVVEQRDLTALPVGYFDDAVLTIGLTAARAIAGGAVLTNQQLLGVKAVERGQTVTLIADGGGMSVRMAGRALTDGLINQRVRVQNLSSGRIVEGIARSAQVVEIFFQ